MLHFCCAANVVTVGVAREPDAYRDSSKGLLGGAGATRSSPQSIIITQLENSAPILVVPAVLIPVDLVENGRQEMKH